MGYECEFVDNVPEDYLCKHCKLVAKDYSITTCCGETFCKHCIEGVVKDKKPCPVCQENTTALIAQRKYQARILALKVYCLMKGRGCNWTGQLQHLDAHLHLTSGDCVYVDVDCPRKCNQKVQKMNVDIHLATECPNRQHMCQFCGFKVTFSEVSQHLETCGLFIVDCPNKCGASFQRNNLEDHIRICGVQKVQCDFSHTGCEAEFMQNKRNDHLEQNTQKHLMLVAATLRVSQEQMKALRKKLQEQQNIFEQKLREQKQEFKTKFQEQQQKIEEKDAQIKAIEERRQTDIKHFKEEIIAIQDQYGSRLNRLCMEAGFPPYEVTISDYWRRKEKGIFAIIGPMYTHPRGYKFAVWLWVDRPRHVEAWIISHMGDHDDKLKFPARLQITLELLNQHRDQDHYVKEIQCEVGKTSHQNGLKVDPTIEFIPNAELEWNADKRTQYLRNDCLKFRVQVFA